MQVSIATYQQQPRPSQHCGLTFVGIGARPHDHRRTNKAYLSAIIVTYISQEFYLQDGGKNQLAQI